jgi:hypothetical protein
MFVHFEARNINIHLDVEECFCNTNGKVEINVYGFIHIGIFLDEVQYLSCFDDGECTLLIKNGEILKEKTK